jgi:hypothetical protein
MVTRSLIAACATLSLFATVLPFSEASAQAEPATCRRDAGGETVCKAKGAGVDEREAQQDAIRRVILAGCDAAVSSSRVYRDHATVRNDLIVYNGCYIRNFRELSRRGAGPIEIEVTATVAQSRLPERLLTSNPQWFEFDVREHAGRLYSLQIKLQNRPRLLGALFEDYPGRALSVTSSTPRIEYQRVPVEGGEPWEVREQGILKAEVSIGWNPGFVDALEDALEIVQDAPSIVPRRARVSQDAGRTPLGVATRATALLGSVVPDVLSATAAGAGIVGLALIDMMRREASQPRPSKMERDPESLVVLRRAHPFWDEGASSQLKALMDGSRSPVLQVSLLDGADLPRARQCFEVQMSPYEAYETLRPDKAVRALHIDVRQGSQVNVEMPLPQAPAGDLRATFEVVAHSECSPI